MYEHKYNFQNFEVRTIHFGIRYGKHVEIHLNDRKYQTSSKIFETPPKQRICRLLLVKKVSECETYFS